MNENKDLIDRLRYDDILDCRCQVIQDEAADAIERLEEALSQITTWCREYPKPTFDQPTKEQWLEAHNLLGKAGGCSLVDITASRRKHVLDGIQRILRERRQPNE